MAVRLLGIAAGSAPLRGMARVKIDHAHARRLRLVKRAKACGAPPAAKAGGCAPLRGRLRMTRGTASSLRRGNHHDETRGAGTLLLVAAWIGAHGAVTTTTALIRT